MTCNAQVQGEHEFHIEAYQSCCAILKPPSPGASLASRARVLWPSASHFAVAQRRRALQRCRTLPWPPMPL